MIDIDVHLRTGQTVRFKADKATVRCDKKGNVENLKIDGLIGPNILHMRPQDIVAVTYA